MKASIPTLHGASQLIFDTVEGVTNAVEGMHETIARHPLPWARQPTEPTRAHGFIASAVYSGIRAVNGAVRVGVDQSFKLAPTSPNAAEQRSPAEIKAIAALNGAFGDHLEATDNTLALPMGLFASGRELEINNPALSVAIPQASPHLVIMVHGLVMSELCWNCEDSDDLGNTLQKELGCTPLYLRYNSGRHISTNGQQLNELLEQLHEAWPVPVESVSLIGHSMGGLLIRSACWYADNAKSTWLGSLQRVVCLGTPHHGSAVAKAGHALNIAMERIPYVEPLAFGKRRSAGIKDLRHGDLLDEDWQGYHPDRSRPDSRKAVPLLTGVDYYFAAATLGRDMDDPIGLLLGDLLVRLDSAMGNHAKDLHHLDVKPQNCRVFHEKNHMDLLGDKEVHRQVIAWFGQGADGDNDVAGVIATPLIDKLLP